MMCPCGLLSSYEDCCGRYHKGEHAPNPEALMRSRYSAYVLKKNDYLADTHWQKTKNDYDFSHEDNIEWHSLEVIRSSTQKNKGIVVFKAYGQDLQGAFCLQETSEFIFDKGIWYYLKGDAKT